MRAKRKRTQISNRRRLLRLQKQIFRSLQAEAESLLGRPPDDIRSYEREYRADFSRLARKPVEIGKAELLRAVAQAEVVLVADFHTFPQAQKTMLRLLRETAPGASRGASVRSTIGLGLELVSTEYQDALDAFQSGRIGLVEFHRATGYARNWGFPWENYAPLFTWAKENGVRLIALNRPERPERARGPSARRAARLRLGTWPADRGGLSELHERDRWAAAVVTDFFHEAELAGETARLYVLYGELHVGSRHLPKRIQEASLKNIGREFKTIAIHQDRDALFWKLAHQGRELETEILKLGSESYCVFSGTPWGRLMSLIAWAEGDTGDPASLEARLGKPLGGELDFLSLMRSDGRAIAKFLAVPLPSFESLGTCTIREADIFDSSKVKHAFTSRERAIIRFHVLHNIRIYLPRISVVYLATPSFNALSEMAAIHLLRSFSGDSRLFDETDEAFFRKVIEHAFGFFGSLVLNPRRKCDHSADHEYRVSLLAGKAGVREAFPGELGARRLALRVLAVQPSAVGKLKGICGGPKQKSTLKATLAAMSAARYVGELLGKRLHRAALNETIALGRVIELCLEPPTDPLVTYRERYRVLGSLLSSASLPRSKRATL